MDASDATEPPFRTVSEVEFSEVRIAPVQHLGALRAQIGFLLAALYLLQNLVGAVEAFAACVPYLLH
jgi:hypothetical protein